MDVARPLRDVFADLAQDEDATSALDVLRASGHPDLPDSLVAEAVGTYADTAPIEVAEHLSPYVMAHSSVPLPGVAEVDAAGWLDAMSTAPTVDDAMPIDPADGLDHAGPDHAGADHGAPDDGGLDDGGLDDGGLDAGSPDHAGLDDAGSDAGLDFGHGTPSDAGTDPANGQPDADHPDADHRDADQHDGGLVDSGLDPAHLDPAHLDPAHLDPSHDPSGLDTLDDADEPDDGIAEHHIL